MRSSRPSCRSTGVTPDWNSDDLSDCSSDAGDAVHFRDWRVFAFRVGVAISIVLTGTLLGGIALSLRNTRKTPAPARVEESCESAEYSAPLASEDEESQLPDPKQLLPPGCAGCELIDAPDDASLWKPTDEYWSSFIPKAVPGLIPERIVGLLVTVTQTGDAVSAEVTSKLEGFYKREPSRTFRKPIDSGNFMEFSCFMDSDDGLWSFDEEGDSSMELSAEISILKIRIEFFYPWAYRKQPGNPQIFYPPSGLWRGEACPSGVIMGGPGAHEHQRQYNAQAHESDIHLRIQLVVRPA